MLTQTTSPATRVGIFSSGEPIWSPGYLVVWLTSPKPLIWQHPLPPSLLTILNKKETLFVGLQHEYCQGNRRSSVLYEPSLDPYLSIWLSLYHRRALPRPNPPPKLLRMQEWRRRRQCRRWITGRRRGKDSKRRGRSRWFMRSQPKDRMIPPQLQSKTRLVASDVMYVVLSGTIHG